MMMSGDDYGQAFHDGETTGRAEERRDVIAYLLDHAGGPVADGVYTLNYIANAITHGHHEGHAVRRSQRLALPQSGEEGKR